MRLMADRYASDSMIPDEGDRKRLVSILPPLETYVHCSHDRRGLNAAQTLTDQVDTSEHTRRCLLTHKP